MSILSPSKANHLFWLGRYAERIFAQLHFLRYYYDLCLDEGREDAILDYCSKLSLSDYNSNRDDFLIEHLYGSSPNSLRTNLDCLNDNSLVLREELTTATLGYVNLCVATLNHCHASMTTNITRLQPISDYVLAFWGSVLQHVATLPSVDMLFMGRHIEYLDMYSRFGYPVSRLKLDWGHLERRMDRMHYVVNQSNRTELNLIFKNEKEFSNNIPKLLQLINSMVKV